MMEVGTRTRSLNSLSTPPTFSVLQRDGSWQAGQLHTWALHSHPLRMGSTHVESTGNMPFSASLFSAAALPTLKASSTARTFL